MQAQQAPNALGYALELFDQLRPADQREITALAAALASRPGSPSDPPA